MSSKTYWSKQCRRVQPSICLGSQSQALRGDRQSRRGAVIGLGNVVLGQARAKNVTRVRLPSGSPARTDEFKLRLTKLKNKHIKTIVGTRGRSLLLLCIIYCLLLYFIIYYICL